VSCARVGNTDVVYLEFSTAEGLKATIKSHFSQKSFLILDQAWGCTGAFRKVTKVMLKPSAYKHVSSKYVLALETQAAEIGDIYRKLQVYMESNHRDVVFSGVEFPDGDDIPNFNGAIWSDNFVEPYSSPANNLEAVFTFDPTLYLNFDISWEFGVPTSVQDLNLTMVGYMGANLTLNGNFNGAYNLGDVQFFSISVPIPVPSIPVNLVLSALIGMTAQVEDSTFIYATVQAGGPVALGAYYDNGFGGIATENFQVTDYIAPVTPTGTLLIDLILTPVIDIQLIEGLFTIGIKPPITLQASTNSNLCIGYEVFYSVSATAAVNIVILQDSWSEQIFPNTVVWTDPCN